MEFQKLQSEKEKSKHTATTGNVSPGISRMILDEKQQKSSYRMNGEEARAADNHYPCCSLSLALRCARIIIVARCVQCT